MALTWAGTLRDARRRRASVPAIDGLLSHGPRRYFHSAAGRVRHDSAGRLGGLQEAPPAWRRRRAPAGAAAGAVRALILSGRLDRAAAPRIRVRTVSNTVRVDDAGAGRRRFHFRQ